MGRFVVTHTAAGDRFLLQGEGGRTLAVSRCYANLDACKKGMHSLCRFAPVSPVVEVSAGEYAPNPKFALYGGDTWRFELLAANGKSVIVSQTYATKKACLRAISLLRTGCKNVTAVREEPAGFKPLTVAPVTAEKAAGKPNKTRKNTPVQGLKSEKNVKRRSLDAPENPGTRLADDMPQAAPDAPVREKKSTPAVVLPQEPAKDSSAASHGAVPRLIRLTPAAPQKPHQQPPEKKTPDKRAGWLERFLKR